MSVLTIDGSLLLTNGSITTDPDCCCDGKELAGCCHGPAPQICETLTEEECEAVSGTVVGPCTGQPGECEFCIVPCLSCPGTVTMTASGVGVAPMCECVADDFGTDLPFNLQFCQGLAPPIGKVLIDCPPGFPPTVNVGNVSLSRDQINLIDRVAFADLGQGFARRSCLNHICLDGDYAMVAFGGCTIDLGQTGIVVIQ